MSSELYIGLMSGTSGDGIDAALVDFSRPHPTVLATYFTPYSNELRAKIFALCQKGDDEIQRLGELDIVLAKEFAKTTNLLLATHSIPHHAIKAIGSHGQNVRHSPGRPHRFTMQIGDPNTIAAETGITTVADFRRKDVALGGQGAPLVPAFHQQIFSSQQINRAIVNIGGIANVTLLPQKNNELTIGFDTGPGNTLMDAWIFTHQNERHDKEGAWGQAGTSHPELLNSLLADPYFSLSAPKSTGREYFNLAWLMHYVNKIGKSIAKADVQATLVELTARSIIDAVNQYLVSGEILICGGGVHNFYLMSRLRELAQPTFMLNSTQQYGIDPDWVEAVAFAWLAKQTLSLCTGNLPSVTGAKKASILGGIYYS